MLGYFILIMYAVSNRLELILFLIVFLITKFDMLIKIILYLCNFKLYNPNLYVPQIQKLLVFRNNSSCTLSLLSVKFRWIKFCKLIYTEFFTR